MGIWAPFSHEDIAAAIRYKKFGTMVDYVTQIYINAGVEKSKAYGRAAKVVQGIEKGLINPANGNPKNVKPYLPNPQIFEERPGKNGEDDDADLRKVWQGLDAILNLDLSPEQIEELKPEIKNIEKAYSNLKTKYIATEKRNIERQKSERLETLKDLK